MNRKHAILIFAAMVVAITIPQIAFSQSKPVFVASLSGDEEVSEPAITDAGGFAVFRFTQDGSEMTYRILVHQITGVVQAHIHDGAAGTNGPVVAFLFGQVLEGTGDVNGVLAEGVITPEDLVGPLVGGTLDDLRALLESGNGYVNVHTVLYPAGEIRGQIR